MTKLDAYTYWMNRDDIITRVSPNWELFALDNGWPDSLEVVGRPLWDYIKGMETRHLYGKLFEKARNSKHIGPIPFRCDAPHERRSLELEIEPLSEGQLRVTSTIVRTEQRAPMKVLDPSVPRSEDMIRMCSMCKKIAVNGGTWLETEEALAHMKYFEAASLPRITHGLCPGCFDLAMAELEEDD